MLPLKDPFRKLTEEEYEELEREHERRETIRRAVRLAVEQIHRKGATLH
jgi:hypothetical protein